MAKWFRGKEKPLIVRGVIDLLSFAPLFFRRLQSRGCRRILRILPAVIARTTGYENRVRQHSGIKTRLYLGGRNADHDDPRIFSAVGTADKHFTPPASVFGAGHRSPVRS